MCKTKLMFTELEEYIDKYPSIWNAVKSSPFDILKEHPSSWNILQKENNV